MIFIHKFLWLRRTQSKRKASHTNSPCSSLVQLQRSNKSVGNNFSSRFTLFRQLLCSKFFWASRRLPSNPRREQSLMNSWKSGWKLIFINTVGLITHQKLGFGTLSARKCFNRWIRIGRKIRFGLSSLSIRCNLSNNHAIFPCSAFLSLLCTHKQRQRPWMVDDCVPEECWSAYD